MQENRLKLYEYYSKHPCVDCGETDPVVLDFDHKDNTNKINDVSTLISKGYSWNIIENEIKKCDIRCANCHRRRTAEQFNWYHILKK